MRFRVALSMATMFMVCFTFAVWASPANAVENSIPEPETQTVSGKIAAVGDAEFTMEIRQNQQTLKVKFLVDGNTKVEGKLTIGSQATVEYRADGSNNIAAHVSVIPASGVQAY
jgi:hypothetical protein